MGSGDAGRMAGPARKLGLVQGFAGRLAGPLKLAAGQALPAEGGPAGPRAQLAASDVGPHDKVPEQLAMQRHSMLSPRGSNPLLNSSTVHNCIDMAPLQHDLPAASELSSVQACIPCARNCGLMLTVPVPRAARPWPFVSKEASPHLE